jgi:hypothetical protein
VAVEPILRDSGGNCAVGAPKTPQLRPNPDVSDTVKTVKAPPSKHDPKTPGPVRSVKAPQPKHDPSVPGAIVMKRPDTTDDPKFSPKYTGFPRPEETKQADL